MNVLLLDLGTPRNEISEPLGIEVIASYVKDAFPHDVSLTLKSLELDNYSDISPYIRNKTYSVIGISTKIRSYEKFKRCIDIIHRKSPKTIIVIGDILGTYAFENVLSLYKNIICVRGEGEIAFRDIVQETLNKENRKDLNLSKIPNLAYNLYGGLELTKRMTIDLKNAKHPYRALTCEVLRQNGCSRLEASRGCIYSKCSYCSSAEKYNGSGWIPFNIDFIIQELITLSNIGFKSPLFTDEDFFGNDIQRIYELADRIIDLKKDKIINPNLDFYVNARVNTILGEEYGGKNEAKRVLYKLKEAGLREMFIGIESGCKEQLTRYKKPSTKIKNIEAIKTLRNLGIEADIGFIFFDTNAIVEDLRKNINFIYEAGISNYNSRFIKRLRIEPRTPLGMEFISKNPHAKINLDTVEYEYRFKYPIVEKIYKIFEAWEKEDLDFIYNIQSIYRGEIPKSYKRKDIKDIISKYRSLDVEYFNEILIIFEANMKNKIEEIKKVTEKYIKLRDNLNNILTNKTKWFDIKFRRNI